MEYTIGKYKFDDPDEYQKALKEAALIKSIRSKYDLADIGMVKKFLILIKQGKLSFHTSIGKDFVSELKDIYIGLSLKASAPAGGSDVAAKDPGLPAAVPAKSSQVPASVLVKSSGLPAAARSKRSELPDAPPDSAVFFYCYVPIIVIAVILLIAFAASYRYINIQYRNFCFIAIAAGLYLLSEIVMIFAGAGFKRYEKEIKRDHLMARIRIPGKLFVALVLAMIALVIVMFVKPFLTETPSAEEKISFRNEVIR